MKFLLLVVVLLASPIAWAQPTNHPNEKEIAAYIEHHNKILGEVRRLMPKGARVDEISTMTHAEYLANRAQVAKQDLPHLKALIVELRAIPHLVSTGASERDAGIRAMHAESVRMAEITQSMIETTIAMDEAARASDETRLDQGTRQLSLDSLELQRAGSALMRAGKTEPRPVAWRASLEGMALVGDGMGLFPKFQLGLMDASDCAEGMRAVAKLIREQAAIVRQELATHPAEGVSVNILQARQDFPDLLDQAATHFQIAGFQLTIDLLNPLSALESINNLNGIPIAQIFTTAWPD